MVVSAAKKTSGSRFDEYLSSVRERVLGELRDLFAREYSEDSTGFCNLMLEYPLRPSKALRPALCLAASGALGGPVDALLPTAAVLELYHNAFLIHDDVEDESLFRRGEATLHRELGLATAINVGDGMFALALRPLLQNTERLGLTCALQILDAVATMVRVTVEGQALELAWIRQNRWEFGDRSFEDHYENLVFKKTGCYSFVTPVAIAAIAAEANAAVRERLTHFARHLGTAFQIVDDLLNLDDTKTTYGKEARGDLWEGKRTLILLHALHAASSDETRRAVEILSRARPSSTTATDPKAIIKTEEDIEFLAALIRAHQSENYARAVAMRHAESARAALEACDAELAAGVHRAFLDELVAYVVARAR